MKIGIVGIHTGIGKTLVSAVLCQAWQMDYWKPVQAGNLDDSDSHFIRKYVSDQHIKIFPEKYRFRNALSPHAAAAMENIVVRLDQFILPDSQHLIIETAGGIMSPLNKDKSMIDLITHLNIPVILVTQNYLGSINHTMLSIETLKVHKIKNLGLIINGEENPESEQYILHNGKLPLLGRIRHTNHISKEFVNLTAMNFQSKLPEELV